MVEFDEFEDGDELVLAYLDQEQQRLCDAPPTVQQDMTTTSMCVATSIKRDRKRSYSVSPPIDGSKVIRTMRPLTEAKRSVIEGGFNYKSFNGKQQHANRNSSKSSSNAEDGSIFRLEEKGGWNKEERGTSVIWPPSRTFASDALKLQDSLSRVDVRPLSSRPLSSRAAIKHEASTSVNTEENTGRMKVTAKNIDIRRDEEGNVTEIGKRAITKHLLSTLSDKHNPITNSDLYRRTAHVVSCATGHQVAQRAGSKFSVSEKTYFSSRNAKLRQQFTAQAREGLRVVEGTERASGSCGGVGTAVGIGGRFGAELSRSASGADDGEIGGSAMVQQSRIFAGLTFYLNGYTGPRISDLELKRLIAVHGGNVSYIANSSCTHVLITKNLSASKTQKFLDSASSIRGGKRKVVHVDWVLDSVAKRRRLDETPYNVIVNKAQPTLIASLGVVKQSTQSDVSLKASKRPGDITTLRGNTDVICLED